MMSSQLLVFFYQFISSLWDFFFPGLTHKLDPNVSGESVPLLFQKSIYQTRSGLTSPHMTWGCDAAHRQHTGQHSELMLPRQLTRGAGVVNVLCCLNHTALQRTTVLPTLQLTKVLSLIFIFIIHQHIIHTKLLLKSLASKRSAPHYLI